MNLGVIHAESERVLHRIDNTLGHSKHNTKLACEYCSVLPSNRADVKLVRMYLTILKYVIKNELSRMLAGFKGSSAYPILRKGVTGGVSNVPPRLNILGQTHINKLTYDGTTVSDYNTPYIMTHFLDIDFNSLYPSVFASMPHEFIKHSSNRFRMP